MLPLRTLAALAAGASLAVIAGAPLRPAAVTAQAPAAALAPAGAGVHEVWHLGRVTGDLERIIAFYHDLVGLDLRGARDQPRLFAVNPTINEFVGAPASAEFRATFLPIPGASAETNPQNQIYLEAFEFRNVERRQMLPALSDPGVSSLRLLVRDLDTTAAAAKAAGVSVITPGGAPVDAVTPVGLGSGARARALMVRDPDGFPVELVQVTPEPPSPAPAASRVLGAQMSVVVADLDASLDFYRRFIGTGLRVSDATPWRTDKTFSQVRGLPDVEHRTAAVALPGSTMWLELVQVRGVSQTPYRPVFQDIGFGHVALLTRDVEAILNRMNELGVKALAQSGRWTQFNPTLRAIYTRDRDGFFIEVIERK